MDQFCFGVDLGGTTVKIGLFTVDGKMIDIAFYDGAKRTIALAKASGVYKGDLSSSSKKTPTSKVGDELRLLPTTNA